MSAVPLLSLMHGTLAGVALGAAIYFVFTSYYRGRERLGMMFAFVCAFFGLTSIMQALFCAVSDPATAGVLLNVRGLGAGGIMIWLVLFGVAFAERKLSIFDYTAIGAYVFLPLYGLTSEGGFLYTSIVEIQKRDTAFGQISIPIGVPSPLNPLSVAVRAGLALEFALDGIAMVRKGRVTEGRMWAVCNAALLAVTCYDAAIDYRLLSGPQFRTFVFVGFLLIMAVRLKMKIDREQSELERLHRELKQSENLYRSLFAYAGDAIFVLEKGRCVDSNPRADELFGVPPRALIGSSPIEYSPTMQPDGPTAQLAEIRIKEALDGRRQDFMWVNRRPNGQLFEVEVSLTRVESKGEPRLIAVVRDVSEVRRAEEERIRLERIALARQRLVFMGQLAAGVAHEFRNPLHGVMQFLELAKRKVNDRAKITDYCEMMSEGLRRMDAISSRLLRLGSDTADQRRMIDLREVVNTTASLAAVLCERKGIRLSVGGISEVPLVRVDAARLAEALLNLLQNSVDACTHGDTITVSLQRVDSDVELAVADTGPGIPKEIRSRLFEPFFTTKPLGKGTGLGLPIAQEVAIDHGGSIRLDETYANGTRFVLRLPAAQFATVGEST